MNAVLVMVMCLVGAGDAPLDGAAEVEARVEGAAGIATPTPAEPSQEIKAEAPQGVIVLNNLSLHYGPVSFDHGLHVKMADFENGCANCHHDISKVEGHDAEIMACRDCHVPHTTADELEESSGKVLLGLKGAYHRQCLSCHKDWSHENACGFCHMPAQGFGSIGGAVLSYHGVAEHQEAQQTYVYETRHRPLPMATFHHADHAQKFGLSCVDCHHGASCGDCHGSGSVSYKMDHRMGTCFQCHGWDNCVTCHDRGEKPAFDHTRRAGWTLEPSHDEMGCTSCHSPEHRFEAPSSARCRACHRVGSDGAFDHAEFGVPLLGDHEYIDCVMCHRGRVHIGVVADCAACHADKHFPEDLPGRAEPGRGEGMAGAGWK
ncbi:MAG: hypothetical protein H6810_00190 [Phycisphaeraceae bacterium]|nr:MAG: hypothetical protein H6810_00190 [Phycisphaeraceae bacterium]